MNPLPITRQNEYGWKVQLLLIVICTIIVATGLYFLNKEIKEAMGYPSGDCPLQEFPNCLIVPSPQPEEGK